ncbi:MAG: AAA family ATPase [Chloroflexota bacterium]|nr:AAA family ATPase [Chloroflexota bacterium]MDE2839317.1 AAA family ATPase [Chloroflexota bacterium]MDE2929879.1 AAA family ATPase [Chloroflexota bacterium]
MTANDNSPSNPMKFRFKKIGPINEAELELGDLTLIAGHNNTGKTYLVYTLYGFLKMWRVWPDVEYFLTGDEFSRYDPSVRSLIVEGLATEVMELGQARRIVDWNTLNQERHLLAGAVTHAFSEVALADVFSSPTSAFEGASIEVALSDDFPRGSRVVKTTNQAGDTFSVRYDGESLLLARSGIENRRWDHSETVEYLASLYLHFLFPELVTTPFVLSAERFGISLFYKELDFTKNRLVDWLQMMRDDKNRKRFSPVSLIDTFTSRYALPIKDNIDYTRSIADLERERSALYEDKLFDDIKDMMEGYYRSKGDDIQFRSKARKERSFSIPLHRASSSARGLSDLYFFFRHIARDNHLLIIDEPESHLDTANQILLARLLARCVGAGLRVLITTHSDYLIKEINNLIMLSRSFPDKKDVIKKLKYQEDDFLAPESVRAYVAEESTLRRCEVDTFGIDMPVFDKTIDQINTAANELASRLTEDVEA